MKITFNFRKVEKFRRGKNNITHNIIIQRTTTNYTVIIFLPVL